jgi:hypothetical protein
LARRDIRLKRGQAHTEVVTLEPTTQRTLSRVLFIGGGFAVGVSLVLSAFAVRSENRAEKFLNLTQTLHKNAQPAQLTAYHASLVERDRFRTSAGVAVAGSIGMFITGIFLHELDEPSLAAVRQRDEPRRRSPESARSTPRFAFVSGPPTADVGASVRVNF